VHTIFAGLMEAAAITVLKVNAFSGGRLDSQQDLMWHN
jgi:hypothetical protein